MSQIENLTLVGLGNKARQGKDYLAKKLQSKLPNCFILHFADPLKKEVSVQEKIPLIFKKFIGSEIYYFLRHTSNDYKVFKYSEMQLLHSVFTDRGISEYDCMTDKDPPILQVWGTDFRRKLDSDYWVKATHETVKNIAASLNGEPGFVLLPDTRFVNELDYIKRNDGMFVRVLRLLDKNLQYIDEGRDPSHPSETELDGSKADYLVTAVSGDTKTLDKEAGILASKLIKKGK